MRTRVEFWPGMEALCMGILELCVRYEMGELGVSREGCDPDQSKIRWVWIMRLSTSWRASAVPNGDVGVGHDRPCERSVNVTGAVNGEVRGEPRIAHCLWFWRLRPDPDSCGLQTGASGGLRRLGGALLVRLFRLL
jgi:hypothetical protein